MKSFSRSMLALSSVLTLAGAAQAQESGGGTTFWIDHDVLRYESISSKPDKGDTEKTTNLVTTPNDVTIGIFWSQYGLYVTPSDGGGYVQGSFYPTKEVEVGLGVGLAHQEKSDTSVGTGTGDTESKTTKYGVFGTYYLATSDKSTAEFSLQINLGNSEASSKPSGGAETKSADNSFTQFALVAQYAWEFTKHVAYVPGIIFSQKTTKDDLADADVKETGLTINLAHFRYIF